ncbi:MAG: hypothetical protein QNJ07_16970, partial [Woeseiaceae bacterium]|nr:hypothetical protein [Woeseiaceae bacterium]
ASIAAIGGAAFWFFYTAKMKPRVQFDVDCRFMNVAGEPHSRLAEIQLVFKNTGFVEHRLWNVTVSVHALGNEAGLGEVSDRGEADFARRILPKTQLVPDKYRYFFVRPGVQQIITHIIGVPDDVSAIRVTAGFDYNRDDKFPHTAQRLFEVPG